MQFICCKSLCDDFNCLWNIFYFLFIGFRLMLESMKVLIDVGINKSSFPPWIFGMHFELWVLKVQICCSFFQFSFYRVSNENSSGCGNIESSVLSFLWITESLRLMLRLMKALHKLCFHYLLLAIGSLAGWVIDLTVPFSRASQISFLGLGVLKGWKLSHVLGLHWGIGLVILSCLWCPQTQLDSWHRIICFYCCTVSSCW